ncbi:MAG TPA: dimethyl sulfoxide reductase anchor subunit [Hellea balneolensis]|uniref:Dimethyl sulfoxide reductase anchor subunit n=1 Tax=Hellea balneolensis TaxID=287478 RepID=A0A7V5NX59_9PROT|nr:dimethyl sulfoxide reductase anchor subunit [Hellea balneolensis]
MHPAKSVIYFTTATGAGYGLFVWLAYLALQGLLPADKLHAFVFLAAGFGLVITGLLSSTGHLGHPERAWRAMSQWRSSWLSREGLMAILTFIPLSIFAIMWFFMGQSAGLAARIAAIGAVMAMITVFTTSMIYASLKTIPAWHNIWTKFGYLTLSLMSGGLLALALSGVFGMETAFHALIMPVLVLLVLGLSVKYLYWEHIKTAKTSTIESATGLGRFGKVTLAARPHSEDNYLLKERGYRIARKHARKIRSLAAAFGFVLPLILLVAAMLYLEGTGRAIALCLAFILCMIGLVFERWLFFAEAKHAVTLYYGEQAV